MRRFRRRSNLQLVTPRRIAQAHWASIPVERRSRLKWSFRAAGLAVGVPVFFGWARVGDVAVAGLTAAATAMAGLLFGLGIQIFGMADGFGAATDDQRRRQMIHDADRLKGLLGNVLHCTLLSLTAALFAGVSLLVTALWPSRLLVAFAAWALVSGLSSFALTVRRLFDLAAERFDRALDPVRKTTADHQGR